MKESNVQKLIQLALSDAGCTTWRNNVAKAWVGDQLIWNADGSLTIIKPRVLNAGLCKGSSDLIGIAPKIVTESMVGSKIGVFFAPEIKSATGRPTKDQTIFLRHVISTGGIAGICRSTDDALRLIAGENNDAN